MIVLSLFDGMSAAQQALKELGVPITRYYASEIDNYAMQITSKNFPNTIQLGNVQGVEVKHLSLVPDLIVAGSPCQDLSFAGKGKGLAGERSGLFFEAIRIIKEARALNPNVKVLIENVKMKQEHMDTMTDALSEALGERVTPQLLNSRLVSAQNRQRLYWYNWETIEEPEDKGILLKDILEDGYVDRDKSYCIDANYYKNGNLKSYFQKRRRQLKFKDSSSFDNYSILSVRECERLQTFPDGYCDGVSNTQAYKMLGNSSGVETVKCILSPIVEELEDGESDINNAYGYHNATVDPRNIEE